MQKTDREEVIGVNLSGETTVLENGTLIFS